MNDPVNLSFDLEPGDDVVYVAEAVEQIERIERGLLALEQNADDAATLSEIFRAAHTLKGSAATIGHSRMAELTHALEEVFGALRSGRLQDLSSFGDLLLPTIDVLRVLVDEIAAGHSLTDAPTELAAAIIDRLAREYAKAGAADEPAGEGVDTPVATLDPAVLGRLLDESVPADGERTVITVAVDAASPWSGVRLLQALMAATETGRLLASTPTLEEIEADTGGAVLSVLLSGRPNEVGDLVARLRTMDDTIRVDLQELDDSALATPSDPRTSVGSEEAATRRTAAHTIRIDVGQLDELMNQVGELIVQKTRLKRQARLLAGRLGEDVLASEAEDGARQFAQIVDQIEDSIAQLRMMPIETVFSRLPRLVRDLSAQLGKDVGLTLDGQETELDRSLLEEIGDPIAHLVRNALDHGIESGTDRLAAGKPPRGTIRVAARQANGRVVVEVTDDGRGMDPAKICAVAVERGLIDGATAATMSDADALRLVFVPGFSTAREITSISGRGVGMDVVQTNVERLGGEVSISSTLGAGTVIAMSLPLTLAIIDALLVRSGSRILAIPLRSVLETQRVSSGDVRTVASRAVLELPRGVVPLLSLGIAMGDREAPAGGDQHVRAVLVRSRGEDLAIAVDEFLGTEEIVIKPLGLPGEQPVGVVGATILADGAVALVLDVDRLEDPERRHLRSA